MSERLEAGHLEPERLDLFKIKHTKKKGLGLFALKKIPTGAHLFHVNLNEFDKLTITEIDKLTKSNPDINGDHSNYVGRGKYVIEETLPAYMNHSCEPNCIFKMRSISIYEVYSIRIINPGEELTHDYGATAIDQLQGHRYWEDECYCDSDNCRKIIHGNYFTLPKSWQRKHYSNLPPSIKRKYRSYFKRLFSK